MCYTLYDDELEHVFAEKDLSVIIDMEISFKEHMTAKIKRENSIMELIQRYFSFLHTGTY